MKEHAETITDLLLGAAYADKKMMGKEKEVIRGLLSKLTGEGELPAALNDRFLSFNPASFDLEGEAAKLRQLGEQRRAIIEMVAAVHDADDEFDYAEDNYLRRVAGAMGLEANDVADLSMQLEIEKLEGSLR